VAKPPEFDIPELGEFRYTPPVLPDSMSHSKPYVAKDVHQEPLGFPGELVDNWQEVAINKLGELTQKYRGLQVYLDSCVKCGACTDKCHYFLGTGDPKNMPVARQDLLKYLTIGTPIITSVLSADDVRCIVLTVLIPQKCQWPPVRLWIL